VTQEVALVRKRGARLLTLVALAMLFVCPGSDAQTRFMYLNGQSIHPAFEGWWPNDDGSFTFWFGYMNSNWEQEFDVAVGPDNYFAVVDSRALDDLELDAIVSSQVDQGQPTHFYPRRNPFLFTIQVPADFGEQELVWTLTTHGRKNRAYASLRPDYRMDTQVMSTEVGGAFGSLDDRLRTNLPPELDVEGEMHRNVRVGESLTLVAFAEDPDNYPPRSDRGKPPETLDELYSTRGVGSSVVSSAPGLRMSWIVYRGPADTVTFAPEQLKAWMDSRAWANSPWSPPYILPEPPADNKWVADVTFQDPGDYVLRAVASDGSHFTYENVMVHVRADGATP
jgi:autonomous glycyl radical cofactor GrcA